MHQTSLKSEVMYGGLASKKKKKKIQKTKQNKKSKKGKLQLHKDIVMPFGIQKNFFRRFHSGMLDNVENDQYLKYH